MARIAPSEPQIIGTKGLGPGFVPVTIVMTIINVAIALAVIFLPLNFLLPSESNPASDSAVGIDALFKFMTVFGSAITIYVSGYTDAALQSWARRIRAWLKGGSLPGPHRIGPAPRPASGREVFVYFDNDVKTHSPFDAMSLAGRLGQKARVPAARHPGPSDEEARNDWPGYGPRLRGRKAA